MTCVGDIFAGEKVFQNSQGNNELRPRQICRREVFRYFQDNDDLRLRQICRRKNL